jgi:hypothetical protein
LSGLAILPQPFRSSMDVLPHGSSNAAHRLLPKQVQWAAFQKEL